MKVRWGYRIFDDHDNNQLEIKVKGKNQEGDLGWANVRDIVNKKFPGHYRRSWWENTTL